MLNMDFTQFVAIDTTTMDWVASPKQGVWRKPLAREEAERGHATSIVRYDPGASFDSHNHPSGEEILVLEGTFSDHTGDFHAGTYFRNPEGFKHSPFSKQGCTILVKLHQMQAQDKERRAIDTSNGEWLSPVPGIRVQMLHEYASERVVLVEVKAGTTSPHHRHDRGEEIYIIKGSFTDQFGHWQAGTWLRYPPGSEHTLVHEEDTLLWTKLGHLG